MWNHRVLSVHKGEVGRYKAGKNSAKSVATATPSLHKQQKVKGHCSLTQVMPSAWLAPAALSPTAHQQLQAAPGGTGRKPKHLWGHEPSYHEHSFHTGFKGSFKGNTAFGTAAFQRYGPVPHKALHGVQTIRHQVYHSFSLQEWLQSSSIPSTGMGQD